MTEPRSEQPTVLTQLRRAQGLSQAALAARVGLSRQALGAVERGRALPGVDVALRLARTLGTDVETLFGQVTQVAAIGLSGRQGHQGLPRPVRLAGKLAKGLPHDCAVPVVWAEIEGRLVLRPAEVDGPADARLVPQGTTGTVRAAPSHRLEPLPEAVDPARSVFLGGCDPAAGLLAHSAEEALPGWRVHVMPMGSLTALAAFADGTLSACGLHIYEPAAGTYNAMHIAETAHSLGADLAVYAYATWEEGLVWATSTGATGILSDPSGAGVRWALRPPGSEARALWQRLAAERNWPLPRPEEVITARTHLDVAHLVTEGSAQAGITLAALAVRHGLPFAALTQEPYVLVARRDDAATRLVLERALASHALQRQVTRLPGYATTHWGEQQTVLAGTTAPRET